MKTITKAAIAAAALFTAASAYAVPINATYQIDSYQGDNGLIIDTSGIASNPFAFELTTTHTFDLFKIWTPEGDVGRDDIIPQPIKVTFNFTSPDSVIGDSVEGSTVGESSWFLFFNSQNGNVTWDPATQFVFGPNGDGLFEVSLSNEDFNNGLWGLKDGKKGGTKVSATFTLIQDASVAVPEPATLALFGLGLAGLGIARRRAA